MRILIIRHGDPDYKNDTLTEKGHREAALLADKLEKENIKYAYVSPMGRARHTAEYTLKRIGLQEEICPWLREFDCLIDRPDTKNKKRIPWDWLPEDWTNIDEFYNRDTWYTHPAMVGGDVGAAYENVISSFDALLARHGYVRQGKMYLAEQPNEDTIAFFCHFGLECVLLSHLTSMSPMILWHGFCALPSSVTTIYTEERRKGKASFRICGFGDISHLYAKGEAPSPSARFCETFDNPNERHD